MVFKVSNKKKGTGVTDFFRDPDGKISATRLSPYGQRELDTLQGVEIPFIDAVVVVKGHSLINRKTGEEVAKIDNDRIVNKIIFKIL